jgi:Flp pilus assembly protein TadG
MRRLTEPERDDHGVATIILICAMAVIFIGAAFAIDVGRYVVEARSAQNSADATVLALATDCARTGSPIADYSPYRKAGQSINTPACGSGEATITVTTPVSDGLLLKQDAGSVDRTATAAWGTLSQATTVRLIISDCEFSQALLDGSTDVTFYLDDTKPQSGCSSLPGGFSQLLDDGGDPCGVTVTAAGTVDGEPGGDLQKQVACITNPTAPALPHDILIPMYDSAACEAADCNGHGPYPVLGFAVLHVTGYSFNGLAYDGTLDKKCPDATRGKYCIRGDFIRFTTSQGTPGPSTDYGTTQVYLSS